MTETLYIDANEPTDVQQAVIGEISKRSDIDIEVEIEGLKTGDFLLGDIVFERKEASDLAGSITDGRLREQTARMSADFHHRYLLLEGNPYDLKYSDLHPNSIVGSLVSTNCKKDVDIVPVDDYDSLAYAVYKICKVHIDNDNFDASEYKLKRSEVETEDIDVAMLSQIDGISPDKAKTIFKETKFDGIFDIVTMYEKYNSSGGSAGYAPDKEVKKVDGIGSELSRRIVDSICIP